MKRLHVLVEGQTEETVVLDELRPHLLSRGVWTDYSILATKRTAAGGKHRGGVSSWAKIEREIRALLGNSALDVLTTMIDYYGMPADAPGMADRPTADAPTRIAHVERAMEAAIASPRFRPHLTLHETESWVLASPHELARRFGDPGLAAVVEEAVATAGGPELVDDGPMTAPSKRLEQWVPGYVKVVDGPAVIATTGLGTIVERCPHARAWLESLTA